MYLDRVDVALVLLLEALEALKLADEIVLQLGVVLVQRLVLSLVGIRSYYAI